MISPERRTELSRQIHSLIAGHVTNDDFDDWLIENDSYAIRDPRLYDDAALGPIVERAYCLYSDIPTYTLTGKRKLDRSTYRDALPGYCSYNPIWNTSGLSISTQTASPILTG